MFVVVVVGFFFGGVENSKARVELNICQLASPLFLANILPLQLLSSVCSVFTLAMFGVESRCNNLEMLSVANVAGDKEG